MTSEEREDAAASLMLLVALQRIQAMRERGEYRQALDAADEARRTFGDATQVHAARPGSALLAGLGSLEAQAFGAALALGDRRGALEHAEHEMVLAQQAGEDFPRARALNNRGLAHHELGELLAAETDYGEALAIIDRSADTRLQSLRGSVSNNLGQLRIDRGEHDAGLRDLAQSITLPPPETAIANAPDEVVRLNNQGFVAMNAGQFDVAEQAWTRALAMMPAQAGKFASAANAAMRGILACNLAELYTRTGRRDAAIEAYAQAIRIHAEDPGSKVALAIDYHGLATLYQQAGDAEKALDGFKQAWDAVRDVAPRSLVALHALRGIGLHRLVQRDLRRARAALSRGMDLYEEMRPAIAITEPGHTGFLEAYRNLLEIAMYLAVHESWADELLTYIERAKARFSQERIAKRVVAAGAGAGAPSDEEMTVEASREPPADASRDASGDALGFNTLVLNYFVGPNAMFVAYSHNRRLGAARIELGEKALADLVQAFRDDLMSSSRRAGQGDAGRQLANALFGKVALHTGRIRHVLLMPDGPLWYLPFEALPAPAWMPVRAGADASAVTRDAVGPVGTVAASSYAPSLSTLAALRRRNDEAAADTDANANADARQRGGHRRAWHLLAIGEPDTQGDFAPLPGTARELQQLEALASGRIAVTVLRGARATKAQFLSAASSCTHLHIASHAVGDFETEHPYVLFSGTGAGGAAERYLRTDELLTTRLRAQLVFLSACSTSVGRSSTGEGVMSMARAFLWAGCRCVVASLWPVDDGSAPEFVRLFYAGLLADLSVAEAARAAREEFRRAHGSPRTWAAFQVFGDADRWEDRYALDQVDAAREPA